MAYLDAFVKRTKLSGELKLAMPMTPKSLSSVFSPPKNPSSLGLATNAPRAPEHHWDSKTGTIVSAHHILR
ncbi:hypothetical protein Nepgr_028832 [Nepenthes gracilis]|uniref:Uncharacterized protein n=1 Tax=Nepenthes gracilis TaxID=150966 RepID=A0AAD3TDL8_NEPGR|nr:hypothetical protein Nepgr_028832 [Nepenthes gracilis]